MHLGKSSIITGFLTLTMQIATKHTKPQYVHCEVQF